ncbi:MAG: hypothetical protein Q9P01_00845 [Anaerolineae bacterium]|nr:hypothetical protein [Anaerolineae bacterium]
MLVAPLLLLLAALACAGTPLAGSPIYTCPTPIPEPTSTVLAGTPMPTPRPQSTPYVMMPPQDFYAGDAVFVGTSSSENGVRFRLQSVASYPASPDTDGTARRVYIWQLEVKNIGTADYEVFPSAQMFLSEISTASGNLSGTWFATREAAEDIAVPFDADVYTLSSGQTRTFRFAAYAPAGQATRFTLQLDPTVTSGSGTINWTNQSNPYCSGDISDP